MNVFSAQEMHKADQAAILAGTPSFKLMKNAGQAVANYALEQWPKARHILLLCGKGNNGGDGYVTAQYLQAHARVPTVLEQASNQDALKSDDCRTARLSYTGQAHSLTLTNLKTALANSDLVIDALFGSGLSRPLDEPFTAIVKEVNQAKVPILSIDVPSGVYADKPVLMGPHIRANHTLQLAGPKRASVFSPAKEAFGTWAVGDIGIPNALLAKHSKIDLLDDLLVQAHLPLRSPQVHKYQAGTVLLIAGSERYTGAAELCCRAAYRAGAGLVSLASAIRSANSWPEIIFEPLDWQDPFTHLDTIDKKRMQARVIGPGLDETALPHLSKLILHSDVPTVLDAGGLSPEPTWQKAVKTHGRCILTPHLGEAARLLKTTVSSLQQDPFKAASTLAERFSAIVVLKGATSLIAEPQGRMAVSMTGHPGMATGGSGDVLAGLIAAWLPKADDLFMSTAASVYLHGKAGELAAQRYHYGLVASDLIEAFPKVWAGLDKTSPVESGLFNSVIGYAQ